MSKGFLERHPECRLHLKEDHFFTKRQAQIVLLLANGYSQGEIAFALGISLDTVKNHVYGTERLDAANVKEVAAMSHYGIFGAIELHFQKKPESTPKSIAMLIESGTLLFDGTDEIR